LIGILLAAGLPQETRAAPPQAELPPSLDWRNHAATTARPSVIGATAIVLGFAAIAALESRYALATSSQGQFVDLSEQTLISARRKSRLFWGQRRGRRPILAKSGRASGEVFSLCRWCKRLC
jgi:hypothetical protein